MFNFENTSLERLIIHKVGNSFDRESFVLSERELQLEDHDLKKILQTYFLSSFKIGASYEFDISGAEEHHKIYKIADTIFKNPILFREESKNIAKLLYDASKHPNIKTGELYVALFDNCKINSVETQSIGIFKNENKDIFLKIHENNRNFIAEYEEGTGIKKMDKGCLIFNINQESGYRIAIVDKINKNLEAQYWRTDFLNIIQTSDNYYHTEQMMQICKQFGEEVLTETNNVEKAQQLAFMQRSQDYFNTVEIFDNDDFSSKVIGQEEVIRAFDDYKNQFQDTYNIELDNQFPVSKSAVAKGKKYFRPVIKLDKNFHLYVHGNPDYIEKGHDTDKKLNYYKLYFNEET